MAEIDLSETFNSSWDKALDIQLIKAVKENKAIYESRSFAARQEAWEKVKQKEIFQEFKIQTLENKWRAFQRMCASDHKDRIVAIFLEMPSFGDHMKHHESENESEAESQGKTSNKKVPNTVNLFLDGLKLSMTEILTTDSSKYDKLVGEIDALVKNALSEVNHQRASTSGSSGTTGISSQEKVINWLNDISSNIS